RPDEMVATQVLVALDLAPGNAERGDHRSRIRLVLMRQEQRVACLIEAAAIPARRGEGHDVATGTAPLLEEPFAVLRVREAERLEESRRRVMEAPAEREPERELVRASRVELADEGDVAVLRDVELPVHAEVPGEVGPAVRGADVPARPASERDGG